MPSKEAVQAFFDFYKKLDKNCTFRLNEYYANEVIFEDPLHQVVGLESLIMYFDQLYARVSEVHFEFSEPDVLADRVWCSWEMIYRHPSINASQPVRVVGASRLDWEGDKIIAHRDFFDAGQMLWEQLPVMRSVISMLKRRMAG